VGEEVDQAVVDAVRESLQALETQGAIVQPISLPHTDFAIPTYYLIATSEASSNLARYDGVRYGPRKEGKDLAASYRRTRQSGFGREVKMRIMLGTFALSSGYYDDYYAKALKVRRLITEDFERAFETVDLIAGPTSPIAELAIGERIADPLMMYLCDILTTPASLVGIPAISVPCGQRPTGSPVGIQLMGPPLQDNLVLQAARALERNREDGSLMPPVAEQLMQA
jgi:aspartyl-tRNA(Asn)/glutamyl-tRNA(Gln) amidotransferase subunit A